jgi:EAL domain-containing protein (putative c-di-GMP-specific phosphodiesterase class I)
VWVLTSASAQAARWQQALPDRALHMNVNVSARPLHDPSFPAIVEQALRETGLAPDRLALELTESLLPFDGHDLIALLTRLKSLGVMLAADDFGTGYSALSHLRAYPIDILKIDRSFIDGIELDSGKHELVRGIVNLSESLHLSVVAEGIEEPEHADQLRRMLSRLGQGFVSRGQCRVMRSNRDLSRRSATSVL